MNQEKIITSSDITETPQQRMAELRRKGNADAAMDPRVDGVWVTDEGLALGSLFRRNGHAQSEKIGGSH